MSYLEPTAPSVTMDPITYERMIEPQEPAPTEPTTRESVTMDPMIYEQKIEPTRTPEPTTTTRTPEPTEPITEPMVTHPVLEPTRTPTPTVTMDPITYERKIEPTPPPPPPPVRMDPMIYESVIEPTPPPPPPPVRMEPMIYESVIEPTPPPPPVRMEPMIYESVIEPTPPPPSPSERTPDSGVMEPAAIAPEDAEMMREMQSRTEPEPPPPAPDMSPPAPDMPPPEEPPPAESEAPTEPMPKHPVISRQQPRPSDDSYGPFVPAVILPVGPGAAQQETTTPGERYKKGADGKPGAPMTPEQAAAERARLLMLQQKGSAILPIALATGVAALLFRK
jgi:hypothetical protein